jgi:hypothetical protein
MYLGNGYFPIILTFMARWICPFSDYTGYELYKSSNMRIYVPWNWHSSEGYRHVSNEI